MRSEERAFSSRQPNSGAGVTHATAQHVVIRGLIDRQAAGSFISTDQGRRGAGGADDARGDEG